MNESVSWGMLFVLALVLIVAGFQGSAGRLLAVVFTPDELEVVNG